jgi:hypothetical protein
MPQMPPPRPPHHTRPRPVSVLVSGPAPPLPTRPVSMSTAPTSRHSPYARPPATAASATAPALPPRRGWSCGVCTLHNPAAFLCCEACGSEKGADVQKHLWTPNEDKRRAASRAV